MLNAPRAALVVDALPAVGGAEKVLLAAMELFPDAPIYTLVYNRKAFAHTSIASRQVITSYLDRLPLALASGQLRSRPSPLMLLQS